MQTSIYFDRLSNLDNKDYFPFGYYRATPALGENWEDRPFDNGTAETSVPDDELRPRASLLINN